MSTIKFVMHNASGGEEFDGRPKRAKHACLPCQTRKVGNCFSRLKVIILGILTI